MFLYGLEGFVYGLDGLMCRCSVLHLKDLKLANNSFWKAVIG